MCESTYKEYFLRCGSIAKKKIFPVYIKKQKKKIKTYQNCWFDCILILFFVYFDC